MANVINANGTLDLSVNNLAAVDSALLFDGVNDYVEIPHNDNLNIDTNFTIELWLKAKPNQLSGDHHFTVVDKTHRSLERTPFWSGWTLQGLAGDGVLAFAVGNGSKFIASGTLTSVLDDQWHHIAGVFNGSTVSIYQDGILNQSVPFTGTPVNNNDPLNFGRINILASRYFNGNIDDVRIWNVARTAEEIQANYSQELMGTESGLIGYWQFSEGTGNAVKDLSGHNNNGTIYGATFSEGFFDSSAIAFSQPNYTVKEDGTPITEITLTRTLNTQGEVSVTITPSNGTATTPYDYNNAPITVTFADGETSKKIAIPIVKDTTYEGNETLSLTLSNPSNGVTLSTQNTATLTIIDTPITYYLTTPATWTDAQAQAQTMGGNLVTINNAQENQFLADTFGSFGYLWTGFNDLVQEGNWQWINGEPVTYTNWNGGEPNNGRGGGEQDYGAIIGSGGRWDDGFSSTIVRGIVEVLNGVPALSITDVKVAEGNLNAVALFTITISGASTVPITVDYQTGDITAIANQDYTPSSGTLTFNPGETVKTITVPIINTTANEPEETFTLTLSNPSNATLNKATGTATIVDGTPVYYLTTPTSWTDAQAQAQAMGGNLVTINNAQENQLLVNAFGGNESFWIGFTDAAQEGDWQWINDETVTFINWNVPEPNNYGNEDYGIINDPYDPQGLSAKWYDLPNNPPAHFPSQLRGIIEIPNGTSTFSISDATIAESQSQATLTVKLTGVTYQTFNVGYSTSNGTAIAGQDYTATSGTLTFNPGESIKTITIPITYDTNHEETETLKIKLSNPTGGAVLGSQNTAIVSILNSIPSIIGTEENDHLIGQDIDEIIYGLGGDDTLTGNGGNDTLNGGDDNDYLEGGTGNDQLDGGLGGDTLQGGTGDDTYLVGNEGDAILFNGSNQQADLGTWFNYQNFTLEMWVKAGETQVQYANIIDNNHTNYRGWVVQQSAGATNNYSIGVNGSPSVGVGFVLTPNTWQHLTCVKDVNSISVYIDGSLVGSSPYSGSIPYDGSQFLRLGNWGGGGRNWNGSMDEVRIWNTARTASEIASNFNRSVAANAPGLVAYYHFNESTGNTSADATVNAHTASLINNPTWINEGAILVDDSGDKVVENEGEGKDTVQSSVSYTLAANVENLILTGTSALIGKGNNLANVLTGNIGNNLLDGGAGNDTLTGGAGNDSLLGGNGIDRVIESADANFTLTNSSLIGNGNDSLSSIEQASLTGGTSDNNLNAANFTLGSVTLNGGAGNDTLNGGSSNDILTGGAGNDSLVGGNGTDRMVESANANFTLTNTSLIGNGNDSLSSIEQASLTGGAGHNNLNASAFTLGSVTLNGGAGNDTLTGGTGNDTLIGGIGNDSLIGGEGNDALTGSAGDDSLLGENGTDRVVESGDFNFTLTNTRLIGNGTDTITSIEQASLTGGFGNNSLNAAGFTMGNVTLVGGEGNDNLRGGAGNDSLLGGNGIDRVIESANANFILTNSSLIGKGTDSLSSIEQASLTGGAGNNSLNAASFTLGSVTLNGGAGNDTILGGSRNDTLLGGLGNDTLTGGAGSDRFKFSDPQQGIDQITDFAKAEGDRLWISATGFGSGLTANQFILPEQITLGSAATQASHRFIYNPVSGALFFDPDGTGLMAQIQMATLNSGLALSHTDVFVTA